MKVLILGLGTIGLAVARFLLEKHLRVWGYDISADAVVRARELGVDASTNWRDLRMDVYVVCVSTNAVAAVCRRIKQQNMLVSVESTVPLGLCRQLYKDCFGRHVFLVHVPHRYWSEDPLQHGVDQMRVIGGVNDESLRKGWQFYYAQLNILLAPVNSVEVAEMCKLAENAHRYVNIAFAEELKMICGEKGLSFERVRYACNSKWNTQLLEARDGIGGGCLPKDIKCLKSLTDRNTLLTAALKVDVLYRAFLEQSALEVPKKERTT